MVWVSFCHSTCWLPGIYCIPGKIHRMTAHISDLPASEIMVHVPQQAAGSWSCSEISRIKGMHLNRTDPLFPVDCFWCGTCIRKITGSFMGAVTPCNNLL